MKLGVFARACPWGDIQSGKRVSSGPRRSLPDGARSRVEDAPGKEDEDSPVSSRFSSSCPASLRTLREHAAVPVSHLVGRESGPCSQSASASPLDLVDSVGATGCSAPGPGFYQRLNR
ncbi:uncharacterized protein LOC105429730 [Pogonomyrmex barbatus]|uniref:Uncharacterized protein LOC105429730 n=1 Tax=Pogonomyrmex barbatus TaxID=144034 RepID=A0A6I9WF67_9HYME|nr:uncharacterized protein LOC105429730 [Pogonomyrmex barbatus]